MDNELYNDYYRNKNVLFSHKRTSSNKNRVPFFGSTFASTLTISFKENLSLR